MWYGMGPGESYVDSKAASIMGIYENTVDGMMTDYVSHRKTDIMNR